MSCGCDDTNPNLTNCTDPCGTSDANTAACESLPSQIQNFTTQFFGTVTKTEVDGSVRWTLPCNLETGLENNPRSASEGLACYFLRLFDEGIVGATGPQGEAGATGDDGTNAYTVTLQSFDQPTLESPTVVFKTSYNPSVLEGLYIFVQGSGWYLVTNTDQSGNVWGTLQKAITGVSGTIPAGRLVVPAGFPGVSVTGPQGAQGIQGVQGDAGESYTETNGQVNYPAGTDYALQVAYAAVNFVAGNPQVLLPDVGTYRLTCRVAYEGQGSVGLADVVSLKLRDTSAAVDITPTEVQLNQIVPTRLGEVVIDVTYTTDGANRTVGLFGKCTTGTAVNLVAARTVISYVRLS